MFSFTKYWKEKKSNQRRQTKKISMDTRSHIFYTMKLSNPVTQSIPETINVIPWTNPETDLYIHQHENNACIILWLICNVNLVVTSKTTLITFNRHGTDGSAFTFCLLTNFLKST